MRKDHWMHYWEPFIWTGFAITGLIIALVLAIVFGG